MSKKRFWRIFFRSFLIFIMLFFIISYSDVFNVEYELSTETFQDTIFCIILTQPKNLNTKALAVNQTWARNCDKHFFIVKLDDKFYETAIETYDPLPIIQPGNYKEENYLTLTDKMFEAYKYIYKKYGNYSWYLKADDDTFILMHNLKNLLKSHNSSTAITFGRTWNRLVRNGYESGGAGYVISNEAMRRFGKKLNEDFSFCSNSGIEDVDTARCLRDLGVESGYTLDKRLRHLFHPNTIKRDYKDARIRMLSELTISFHYVQPAQMYKLYYLLKNYSQIKDTRDFNSIILQVLD